MVYIKVLSLLCAIVALFRALSYIFGWSHRYGWKFLITKTESMLSGILLRQYKLYRAILSLLSAGWCLLFLFEPAPIDRKLSLVFITLLAAGAEKYFRQFTPTS